MIYIVLRDYTPAVWVAACREYPYGALVQFDTLDADNAITTFATEDQAYAAVGRTLTDAATRKMQVPAFHVMPVSAPQAGGN